MYPFVNTGQVIFSNHAKRYPTVIKYLVRGLIFLLPSFFCVNFLFAQQSITPPKKPSLRFPKKEIRNDFFDDQQKISRFVNQNQSAFKIDSTLVDTTAVLGRMEGLLEEKAVGGGEQIQFESSDFKQTYFDNVEIGVGDSRISQKLKQQDFLVPKEKLYQARESLLSEKKKYTAIADTRVKEVATKRQSLRHLSFSQRLEYGVLAQIRSKSSANIEIHPQIGYAISKRSVLGFAFRLNPQDADFFNGIKFYFNRQFARNFQWITEYSLSLNSVLEGSKSIDAKGSPLFTGLGGDIRLKGKLYLRTAVLIPFGLGVFENPHLLNQSVFQLNLMFKPIK
jgi:hypothetical protein